MRTCCLSQGTPANALRWLLNGKEIQKGGDICVCITDLFCCPLETLHCKAAVLQQKFILEKAVVPHQKKKKNQKPKKKKKKKPKAKNLPTIEMSQDCLSLFLFHQPVNPLQILPPSYGLLEDVWKTQKIFCSVFWKVLLHPVLTRTALFDNSVISSLSLLYLFLCNHQHHCI